MGGMRGGEGRDRAATVFCPLACPCPARTVRPARRQCRGRLPPDATGGPGDHHDLALSWAANISQAGQAPHP